MRLQELEFQYRDSLPPPPDHFWEPGQATQLASFLRDRTQADRLIREQLIAEFGEEARTSAELRSVFYPLDMQHPYLSSENQIRLREYQLENQIALLEQQRSLPESSSSLGASPVIPNAQRNIEEVLDPDALREYRLRTSPLARKLADADLKLGEQQFRQIYALLERVLHPGAAFASLGAIRYDLEKLIGKQSALKVLAALDGGFDSLRQIGHQQGLSGQQILQAYEIFAEIDARIADAYQMRDQDSKGYTRIVSAALAERETRLSGLVGQKAASLLIRARSATANGERRTK